MIDKIGKFRERKTQVGSRFVLVQKGAEKIQKTYSGREARLFKKNTLHKNLGFEYY